MATKPEQLPLVGILTPFPFIASFEEKFSDQFLTLKPTDPSIPLHEFLKNITKEFLDCLPSLGCILLTCVGLDNIDLDECKKRGILIGNAGTCYSEDVADYAIGLLIDVLRRISSGHRLVRSGLWTINKEFPLGSKLKRKRVGIVGLGSIGSEVAKRLVAFNCIISYTSRNKKPSVPFSYYSSVVDLPSHNDVLILTCELNKQTFHIIDKDVMSALGKEGIIINEMVRCLVQGELGGAGLDVFENEPHVPKELIEMDNVVLTHHNVLWKLGIVYK
ncbi:hypothetical protein MKW92_009699 [Papaver armeniacum]|nr:hypothetical protein MKW92_009699 [Papaver armeniacum]